MSKPLSDEQRQRIADEVTDLATAFANALVVRSPNGRNLIEIMREQTASEISAASYDGSPGHGSDHPDPTHRAYSEHHAQIVDEARRYADQIDVDLMTALTALNRLTSNAARFLPRPARPAEQQTAELEEANKDAGCECCARITDSNGVRRYRATYATGKVTSKSEAEEKGTERRRRALLTREDNRDRLAVDTRLCRSCYEKIKRRVQPGSQLTLGEAYPLRALRADLNKEQAA